MKLSFAAVLLLTPAAAAQHVIREFWGTYPNQQSGAAMQVVLDFNHDGFSDVAVSGPGYGAGTGEVSIISGAYLTYGWAPLSLDYIDQGGFPGGTRDFGRALVATEDLTSDSQSDLVVGAPLSNTTNGVSGAVELIDTQPYLAFFSAVVGDSAGDEFGSSLAYASDVNGDGYGDVLVGAPGHSTDDGIAYLLSGKYLALGTGIKYLWTLDDGGSGSRFGEKVASGADFNGDGRMDLVVAAPRSHGPLGAADSGLVRVYSGWSGAQMWVGYGASGERFGSAVAIVNSLDGDTCPDVAIGAPYSDAGATNGGRVVVYSGWDLAHGVTTEITEWTCTTANAHFGASIASVGDVNHDGRGDVAVGAPDYVPFLLGNDNGSVFVYSGETLQRMGQFIGADEQHAGRNVAAGREWNGDSVSDFLISADNRDSMTNATGYVAALSLFPETPSTYCTAKTNSAGCAPSMTYTGTADLSSSSPFLVRATNVVNQKFGLFFYGFAASATPFQGGWLCVAPPTKRTPVQSSGGSATGNDCTGAFSLDFNALLDSGTDPELVLGQEVFGQYWSRDPASPSTTSLTNGLRFLINP